MSEFLARHGAHILVLGGPIVLLAGMFAMLELTRPDRTRTKRSIGTWLLALAWAGAATTHVTIIKEHFGESALLGTFFLALALMQYSYAVAVLVRANTRLLIVGMIANVSVILLWTYTRVVAIPFGLGAREPVGVADVTATALEVVAIALALIVLRRPRPTAAWEAASPRWSSRPVHGE